MKNTHVGGAAITPDEWASRLSGPADLSSDRLHWQSAMLRHWTGTSPHMSQPLLDHHYIVQHLGGAKQVERRLDGSPVSSVVANGSITIVPVGTQFKWHTRGPIEFAHLYISPSLLGRTALRLECAHEISLVDKVGCRDPLLEALYASMLAQLRRSPRPETLYMDCLLETFLLRLVLAHSSTRVRGPKVRETLAAYQLRRVKEYVEAHMERPLALADLADAAGGSVFHFVRSFRNTVGYTPYNYVLRRRSDRAKSLLNQSDQSVASIAAACGFRSTTNFVKTFKRLVGTTPSRYRRR